MPSTQQQYKCPLVAASYCFAQARFCHTESLLLLLLLLLLLCSMYQVFLKKAEKVPRALWPPGHPE